jgi:hypothetical protein
MTLWIFKGTISPLDSKMKILFERCRRQLNDQVSLRIRRPRSNYKYVLLSRMYMFWFYIGSNSRVNEGTMCPGIVNAMYRRGPFDLYNFHQLQHSHVPWGFAETFITTILFGNKHLFCKNFGAILRGHGWVTRVLLCSVIVSCVALVVSCSFYLFLLGMNLPMVF